ncbi:DNA-processing protein DprA [Pseudoxanthomonas dokdonensis]|uniref:DNA processing protein DprA n=1 Tax=Pseudoxanthomonas dokdonensis TaxID=344882 RepID=A0A0R0CVM1_9GAMM|nr:DNA-processing protein DprA [Pseudoxanthomonas dokdonensis]KRG69347.1 DNA processing protein DprA [Pseudoxanthomonas dokdonensis]
MQRPCPDTPSHALALLAMAPGRLGPRRALLEHCRCPLAVLAGGRPMWRRAGLDEAQQQWLARPDEAILRPVWAWLDQDQHHLLGLHDADYPPLLRRSPSAPLALYVDGCPQSLWHPGVAVVGSRSPSAGGGDNARDFASALARAGIAVISGMAAGIDARAHLAALQLDGGITVAVVGTGPDIAYPRQHAELRDRIAARGAIVSEHPPGTRPLRSHFPSRNRILAGLALATLVVEAAERSGALITARLAGDLGREVFAVPGSIHNPMARGCHRLIREGAGLIESAAEVIAAVKPLAWELGHALRQRIDETEQGAIAAQPANVPATDPDYQKLWLALGHDPTCMDELVPRTGLTAAQLSSMLLAMELDGRIAVEHGRYSRNTKFLSSTASRTQAEGQ